jgi:hypothetical protein
MPQGYDLPTIKAQLEDMNGIQLRRLRATWEDNATMCRLIDLELKFRADICTGISDDQSFNQFTSAD